MYYHHAASNDYKRNEAENLRYSLKSGEKTVRGIGNWMVKLVGVKKRHQPKMKILILAIVLCAVDGQSRGYKYGRQSYNGYARQDPEPEPQTENTVTGQQMVLFIIKTLKNLQSLFESYQWDDLYQRPDTTMQLPNKFQERRSQRQGQSGWNSYFPPAQRQATLQGGPPPRRQAFPRPPPPLPQRRTRSRRSEDIAFRGYDPNPMPARPIRTTTTARPTTTTTRRPRT